MMHSSLFILVFVLGLRHGLDADHLAYIDGQTRYHWRIGSKTAPYVGTLFSTGHGFVVAGVGVIIGEFAAHFAFPGYVDAIATWVSVASLFALGTLNVYNLSRPKQSSLEIYEISGWKGRFLPRFARESRHPLVIVVVGGLFALAADTVSQTSVWALAAGHAGNRYLPLVLGLVFMGGMILTDTTDCLLTLRMVRHTGQLGQTASRLMGWLIVVLSYGVSIYELVNVFFPKWSVNFETVGLAAFFVLLLCYLITLLKQKGISQWQKQS
jgi:nickel/cobalt transporter (NiCoT) family protein